MELQREVNQRAGKNKEKKRGEGERGGSFARNPVTQPLRCLSCSHLSDLFAPSLQSERLEQARLERSPLSTKSKYFFEGFIALVLVVGFGGVWERKNIFLASSQIVNESRFDTHSRCPPGIESAGSRRSYRKIRDCG